MWLQAFMRKFRLNRTKKYFKKQNGQEYIGHRNGALFGSNAVDRKQQRISLMIENAFSDGVDTHVTARLPFKPTCFTAASLTQHPPASHFRSTTLHVNYSSSHRAGIIPPDRMQTSGFPVFLFAR